MVRYLYQKSKRLVGVPLGDPEDNPSLNGGVRVGRAVWHRGLSLYELLGDEF